MLRQSARLLLLLLVALPLAAATPGQKIDDFITSYHKLRQFNGAALVARDGEVLLRKGYGMANMEWQVPNTPDTKFRLASITKQFTAMVIMQLVAEGKIGLDEKITKYVPSYRADTGGRVTVRHLLTHTSGIPSYTSMPGFWANHTRNPAKVDEFIKNFASGDLEFEPGSKFVYNNSGYFILGAIIEQVTGKPYAAALDERIFKPLQMNDSGYDLATPVIPKRASGYRWADDRYENAPYIDMTIPYAAGSLYSTVDDLYKWDRALYGEKLLREELKRVMFTPLLDEYAFGWHVGPRKLADGKTEVATVMHSGGIPGFNTLIVRVPETREVVILLDNTSRGDKLESIADGVFGLLRGMPAPAPKKSIVEELSKAKSGAKAVARYRQLKQLEPSAWDFRESELNVLGYRFLRSERTADAIEIFKLNVELFPASFNVYDSLGEAYAVGGQKDLAIANYRKSVELNPKNTNGVEAIERLEKPAPAISAALLDKYVGVYEIAPNFSITFTREGETLYGQATGQPRFALVADSPTEFHLTVVEASISFAPDGSSMVLRQGGRDMPGRRIQK